MSLHCLPNISSIFMPTILKMVIVTGVKMLAVTIFTNLMLIF